MLYYIFLAAAMIAADQLIKYWAVTALKGQSPLNIIEGFFRLRYVENDGAAFSMLRGKQVFFVVITIAAFAVLVYMLKKRYISGKLGYYAVAFITGGALGNFIDRVRLGYVVDMFDWCWINFPVFNFADLCITAGAILFIVMSYLDYKKEAAEKKDNADA